MLVSRSGRCGAGRPPARCQTASSIVAESYIAPRICGHCEPLGWKGLPDERRGYFGDLASDGRGHPPGEPEFSAGTRTDLAHDLPHAHIDSGGVVAVVFIDGVGFKPQHGPEGALRSPGEDIVIAGRCPAAPGQAPSAIGASPRRGYQQLPIFGVTRRWSSQPRSKPTCTSRSSSGRRSNDACPCPRS